MRTMQSSSVSRVIVSILLLTCSSAEVYATTETEPIVRGNNHPAWSPDGQHIAFDSGVFGESRNVWLIHPDGTGLERVTTHPAGDFEAKWGPGSSTLYFISLRTGKRRLWKKDLLTSSETQVTEKAVWGYAASHNGNEMILDLARGESTALIFVSTETGEELRWLATKGYDPAWSPDDSKVVFGKADNLWVRNSADRGNLQQITSFEQCKMSPSHPDWSVNGFIAFDCNWKIYKVKPDGTDLTCIFQDPDPEGWAHSPSWSPDGTKLVLARLLFESEELWIINADGTGLTQVTHTVADLSFDPDEGTYTGPQAVTITCTAPGATVRYTTDDTDPTESSTQYTEPITVAQSLTLKAKAWKTGWFPSIVERAEYVIE